MLACGRASRRPSRTRGTSRPPSWGCRASASSQPRGSMPCPNYHTYIPLSMIYHAYCNTNQGRRRAQRLQQRRVLVQQQQQQRVKPPAPLSSLIRMLCSRSRCAACMCMCVCALQIQPGVSGLQPVHHRSGRDDGPAERHAGNRLSKPAGVS